MGQGKAGDVRRVSGSLCFNPTDLGAPFPHGGTALGLARDTEFRPHIKTTEVLAEEFGNETTEVFYTGERAIFAAQLWSWDADALRLVWPDTTVEEDGTITLKREPGKAGGVRAGTQLSSRAVKLFFSPDNPNDDPAVLLYRAIPMVEESAGLAMHLGADLGVPTMWLGIQDGQGRIYRQGNQRSISL